MVRQSRKACEYEAGARVKAGVIATTASAVGLLCSIANMAGGFQAARRTSPLVARWLKCVLLGLSGCMVVATAEEPSLTTRPWFEARTAHFRTYSCGGTQQVAKLTARLEQFHKAYETLAGTQAVASASIKVLAFPDHDSLKYFLPLYHGEPMNLSGFFHRGIDENLIVLSLADGGAGALDTIFHEYAHLLLRRNQQIWPLWLSEGMADIYATFEVTGDHGIRIGKAQAPYLRLLANDALMPLPDLFAVTHDSPEYNEQERQGVFYAESWLLTHYLMIGSPARRASFGRFTALLREGQIPEQAFTNAFHTSLSSMQKEVTSYLHLGKFDSLNLSVRSSLLTAQAMATRPIGPAETCFTLGDELARIGRGEDAEPLFNRSLKLAPASPLPFEGLGLLATERGDHPQAVENLKLAIEHGSRSFVTHYLYARERLMQTAPTPDNYSRLGRDEAREIEKELEASLALMPDFGPAHHLLAFLELLQNESLAGADQHLRRAIELEPENSSYLLTLAQVQMAERKPVAARLTLQQLQYPYIDGKLRAQAKELLDNIASGKTQ
jgi:Flp pilus assembly protein TadD